MRIHCEGDGVADGRNDGGGAERQSIIGANSDSMVGGQDGGNEGKEENFGEHR